MERWQEPQMHEKERALTPVEAFGIVLAEAKLRAAYLGTTAPRLSDEDTDEFDPAAFSAFVAATEHESVEVPAGEWAPPGLDLD
jgi:hypothetical protein